MTSTAMTKISGYDLESGLEAIGQRPGADQGDPQLRILEAEHGAAADVGFWECTPGGWPVNDRQDTEVAYILSGKGEITDQATGDVHAIGAGDLVILPVGWTGRWNITETVRKVYVIF